MIWGRPPLVSLFSERKEKGQKLTRNTLTQSFQNQAGLLRTSSQAFVLSIDVKVLTSLLMDLKSWVFLPKWKKDWGPPCCSWAGARAPRNSVSSDNQLRASTGKMVWRWHPVIRCLSNYEIIFRCWSRFLFVSSKQENEVLRVSAYLSIDSA